MVEAHFSDRRFKDLVWIYGAMPNQMKFAKPTTVSRGKFEFSSYNQGRVKFGRIPSFM